MAKLKLTHISAGKARSVFLMLFTKHLLVYLQPCLRAASLWLGGVVPLNGERELHVASQRAPEEVI